MGGLGWARAPSSGMRRPRGRSLGDVVVTAGRGRAITAVPWGQASAAREYPRLVLQGESADYVSINSRRLELRSSRATYVLTLEDLDVGISLDATHVDTRERRRAAALTAFLTSAMVSAHSGMHDGGSALFVVACRE